VLHNDVVVGDVQKEDANSLWAVNIIHAQNAKNIVRKPVVNMVIKTVIKTARKIKMRRIKVLSTEGYATNIENKDA